MIRKFKSFAALVVAEFFFVWIPPTWSANLPPLETQLNPAETAIVLVDFQNNFAATDGEMYPMLKKTLEETRMLENAVDLVKKGRASGIQIVETTEAFTSDYRELDWTNPGNFHRGQIARGSWKIGSKGVELYEPLRPGPADKDILLPNRISPNGFGGNSLDSILRSHGIKNVVLGGFMTDVCVYATLLSAYENGYHVYALKDVMAPFSPQLSAQLLKEIYPLFSRVIGYQEFLQMIKTSNAPPK